MDSSEKLLYLLFRRGALSSSEVLEEFPDTIELGRALVKLNSQELIEFGADNRVMLTLEGISAAGQVNAEGRDEVPHK